VLIRPFMVGRSLDLAVAHIDESAQHAGGPHDDLRRTAAVTLLSTCLHRLLLMHASENDCISWSLEHLSSLIRIVGAVAEDAGRVVANVSLVGLHDRYHTLLIKPRTVTKCRQTQSSYCINTSIFVSNIGICAPTIHQT
jgi:hypothetical protein